MLNKSRVRQMRSVGQPGPELENHFILRLPEPQAGVLRDAISQGQTNIKDRLSIQIDHTQDKDDMRNGIITLDTLMYKARLVDMPTIMETWKTIDGKNFYKCADVCQMFMIREGEDSPEEEDLRKKKRDPHKVDKKYLWPHGYTPPLKNVRKRRFRKTLRKKNLDMPDVEKEVKRLLRTDNEAESILFEVLLEDEDKKGGPSSSNTTAANLDEELFGEVLSSSDDEFGPPINIIDEDEDSRVSVEDSSLANTNVANTDPSGTGSPSTKVTEFSSAMFGSESDSPARKVNKARHKRAGSSKRSLTGRQMDNTKLTTKKINKLKSKLTNLDNEMTRLLSQKADHKVELNTIDNATLKLKFQAKIDDIDRLITDKENEIEEIRIQLLKLSGDAGALF